MSLTGLDILPGLCDRARLSLVSVLVRHCVPLTSGNVESQITDDEPNVVQPSSFYRQKSFSVIYVFQWSISAECAVS